MSRKNFAASLLCHPANPLKNESDTEKNQDRLKLLFEPYPSNFPEKAQIVPFPISRETKTENPIY